MTGVPASAARRGAVPKPKTASTVRPVSLWNIANILTMVRLLLVPAFVLLMVAEDGHDPAWRSFAWAAFTVAMITDLFDGELARRYDLVTDFGKIADPIADKAIMGAALICLSALSDLPWWVTGVILFRELGITLLRFWVIRHGVIPASRGGKLKTLAQGVAVGMYVLALTGPLATARWWAMAVAVVLTVVTGLDYVRQAVVLRRAGLAAEKATPTSKAAPTSSGTSSRTPSSASSASSAPAASGRDGGRDGERDGDGEGDNAGPAGNTGNSGSAENAGNKRKAGGEGS
ncbi:CDP-diacylglycerol--glycerol-3-phosphate 3-phosphatidyltransferase [Streptomyces smyrnaeus]|uniref:CDP-diacylglycerol--glycerol-3-phosphate 3-phosphatidyltransferase n=1 Tax=Streptomyces smyrnaeus TaxID=1387713 RepID=UPI0036B0E879